MGEGPSGLCSFGPLLPGHLWIPVLNRALATPRMASWMVLTCHPSFPQALPLLNVNRGPWTQTCSLSRGHTGNTRELQGQKHQPVSRSGSPGPGARHSLPSPRPLEAAFWTLTPGSFSRFGSSTSAPLAVAAQTACGSSRFLLEGAS